MAPGIGDGTGSDSTPEDQGLTVNEDAAPENPGSPYDSNRGGRGPEVQPARSTPLGGEEPTRTGRI